jgi:hypothetical protein
MLGKLSAAGGDSQLADAAGSIGSASGKMGSGFVGASHEENSVAGSGEYASKDSKLVLGSGSTWKVFHSADDPLAGKAPEGVAAGPFQSWCLPLVLPV